MSPGDFRDLIRYMMVNPFLTDVAVANCEAGALNLADPFHSTKITWSWPIVGPPGKIPIPPLQNEGQGVACVATEVTAPASMRTRLQFGAAHPVQVWLNGKSVYQGTPSKGPAEPDQAGVELQLKEGVNWLVFEIRYQGEREMLYARLLDPQRQLRLAEAKRSSK
jgi:hypothetical protein